MSWWVHLLAGLVAWVWLGSLSRRSSLGVRLTMNALSFVLFPILAWLTRPGTLLSFLFGMAFVIVGDTLMGPPSTSARANVGKDGLLGVEEQLGNYEAGRFAWLLRRATPLALPVEARGALGLWEWPHP